MNRLEKLQRLNKLLLEDMSEYKEQAKLFSKQEDEQFRLFRSLVNVRQPKAIDKQFINLQDSFLKEDLAERGIVHLEELSPIQEGLYLWQGDITRLQCGAIVNAANSGMTGCYQPCHACIDNCIHTYAGVQLRLACSDIMKKQGYEEPTGHAKITRAYNLPCEYVLHTVGPIIYERVTQKDEDLLASCYHSCLSLAQKNEIKSIAFCCISTGVFRFPNQRAAEIAVDTVKHFKNEYKSEMKVVFNVFKDLDYEIYRKLLTEN